MTQNNHRPTEFNGYGGVDLNTIDSLVQPGQLRDGKNISYQDLGLVGKRSGFERLGTNATTRLSGAIDYKGSEYRVTNNGSLDQYQESINEWSTKSSNLIAGRYTGNCFKLVSNISTQIDTKCAVASDGRVLVVYSEYNPILAALRTKLIVVNKSGSRVLDEQTLSASVASRNSWVSYNSVDNEFLVTFSNLSANTTTAYIVTSSNGLSGPFTLSNAEGMVHTYMADQQQYISFSSDSSGGAQIQKITTAGAFTGSKVTVATFGVDGTTTELTAARQIVYVSDKSRIAVIWSHNNGGTKHFQYAIYDRDLNAVKVATDFDTDTDDDSVDTASIVYNTTDEEFGIFYTKSSASSRYDYTVRFVDCSTNGTLGTPADKIFRTTLASDVKFDLGRYTFMTRSFLDVQLMEQQFCNTSGTPLDEKLIFTRSDGVVDAKPLHKYGFDVESRYAASSFSERNSGRDVTLPGGYEAGGVEDVTVEVIDKNEAMKANLQIFNNNLYISTGSAYVKKWDSSLLTRAGMPNFIDGETPAVSGGGLTGDYQWALTFSYQDNNGVLIEGPPNFSATVAMTADQADFTIRTLRNTNNFDASSVIINIYRTQAGGVDFFLTAQVVNNPNANTVSYTDNASDATIAANEQAYFNGDVLTNDEPQGAKFLVNHLNKMFYFNTCQFPSSGFYSKDGNADHVPTQFRLDFSVKDGEPVTGAVKLYDVIVVFKRTKIFIVQGLTGPADDGTGNDLSVRQVMEGIGCISPRSIAASPNHVYFNSGKDIWRMSRSFAFEKVGQPMARLHDLESDDFPDEGFGIVNPLHDEYLYSFATTSNTPAKAMMGDYEAQAWSPWTGVPAGMTCGFIKNNLYHIGTNDGGLYRALAAGEATDYTDAGTPIDWEVVTPWHYFDSQTTLKRVREAIISLFHKVPSSVVIEVYVDYQSTPVDIISIPHPSDPRWGLEDWGEFVWGGLNNPQYKFSPTKQKVMAMSFKIKNSTENEHGGVAGWNMNVRAHNVLKGSGGVPE